MFIGRTAEMSELNRLYGTGSFEMPVIYGRRRVGKTRLITEFIQGKKAIYFQARRTNAEANLHGFSQAILAGSVQTECTRLPVMLRTKGRFLCQRTIGFVGLQKHINSGYAFAERQIAHNGKRGKGTRSPHGLKDYPT